MAAADTNSSVGNDPGVDGSTTSLSPTTPANFAQLLEDAFAGKQPQPQQQQPLQPVATINNSAPVAAALIPVGRSQYTHAAMVDLMVLRPDYSHSALAAHFGRPASWLSSVLASEQFQLALDSRRHEIADPSLTATLHERFKALAISTSNVMLARMDNPEASDFLVLKAGEIAFKALGMGQKGADQPQLAATAAPATDTLAERLMAAMDARERGRTVDMAAAIDADEISPDGNI